MGCALSIQRVDGGTLEAQQQQHHLRLFYEEYILPTGSEMKTGLLRVFASSVLVRPVSMMAFMTIENCLLLSFLFLCFCPGKSAGSTPTETGLGPGFTGLSTIILDRRCTPNEACAPRDRGTADRHSITEEHGRQRRSPWWWRAGHIRSRPGAWEVLV